MQTTLEASSEILEINSLTEEIKRRQVTLSPDVRTYLNEETEKLTAKLVAEQDITKEDMAFVEKVRLWIEMPEEWQEKFPSIEAIKEDAQKKHISLRQWLDLLHVTQSANKKYSWVNLTFDFPGGGKIVVEEHLDLDNCTALTHIPDNLNVGKKLFLNGCTSLTRLPENLEVNGLELVGCTSLRRLPKNLKAYGGLNLMNCTSLINLPDNLEVGGDFMLSNNLQDRVKEGVERLKKEGKIKGSTFYGI